MIEEVRLPEISENVESGVVVAALVKIGDFVEKEQPLVELETEKATFEVPSPVSGKVVEFNAGENDEVKVGQVLAKIETDAEASRQEEEETPPAEPESAARPEVAQEAPAAQVETAVPQIEQPEPTPAKTVSAAPAVRQLARQLGIDIAHVTGSGQEGRISVEDVKSYADSAKAGGGTAPTGMSLPDFAKWGQVERQPMTITRRKIAETLSYAWANVPHVTQHDQADIGGLEQFRAQYAERVQQAGGKLTMTSILVKVIASALKAFPKFNASVDTDGSEIIFKKYYHISVAVDTDRGLLVPTIRDVDKKSILQLSVELKDIADRARENKVTPEEMTGGNFTISNLGGIGGTAFSPIIYWPQVAILGVARARKQAEYVDGEIRSRLILPLSLSYDHRIIDGIEGVRFLRWIAETLEKPFLLALEEQVI